MGSGTPLRPDADLGLTWVRREGARAREGACGQEGARSGGRAWSKGRVWSEGHVSVVAALADLRIRKSASARGWTPARARARARAWGGCGLGLRLGLQRGLDRGRRLRR